MPVISDSVTSTSQICHNQTSIFLIEGNEGNEGLRLKSSLRQSADLPSLASFPSVDNLSSSRLCLCGEIQARGSNLEPLASSSHNRRSSAVTVSGTSIRSTA